MAAAGGPLPVCVPSVGRARPSSRTTRNRPSPHAPPVATHRLSPHALPGATRTARRHTHGLHNAPRIGPRVALFL
eukprot:767414-Prymnesium_polylepis.1